MIHPIAVCDAGRYGANCTNQCACVEANTQTCSATDGACTCRQGWQGNDCSEDVDECLSLTPPPNAVCVNTDGSFVFYCNPGYVMAADGTCTGKDNSVSQRPNVQLQVD